MSQPDPTSESTKPAPQNAPLPLPMPPPIGPKPASLKQEPASQPETSGASSSAGSAAAPVMDLKMASADKTFDPLTDKDKLRIAQEILNIMEKNRRKKGSKLSKADQNLAKIHAITGMVLGGKLNFTMKADEKTGKVSLDCINSKEETALMVQAIKAARSIGKSRGRKRRVARMGAMARTAALESAVSATRSRAQRAAIAISKKKAAASPSRMTGAKTRSSTRGRRSKARRAARGRSRSRRSRSKKNMDSLGM